MVIFSEQPISEAVITVPPYFNQAERRAMLRAADLSGLKVLQLMNDNTAGKKYLYLFSFAEICIDKYQV